MINKDKLLFAGITILIFVGMIMYIGYINNKLKLTQDKLAEAQVNISILKKEKANLIEYNIKRDEQLAIIKKEYDNKLKNIPEDVCGNAKPSKELLDFFRKNIK